MVSCTNTDSNSGSALSENCQHLPLDRVFKSNFHDVRNPLNGGGKKSNKHKGGSINYILDVSQNPIGGLTEVVRHTSPPLYVDGKPVPSKDMCGGKRTVKSGKRKNKRMSKNNRSKNNKSKNNKSKNNRMSYNH